MFRVQAFRICGELRLRLLGLQSLQVEEFGGLGFKVCP